jgi:hypothetical protein
MTAGGSAFAHPMSERRINETDGSYWPTPLAADGTGGGLRLPDGKRGAWLKDMMLNQAMWPTPLASDSKGATKDRFMGSPTYRGNLKEAVRTHHQDGQLNPNWVAWLMGFPIGWANLKATVTRKSHSKPPQLTDS